MSPVVLVVCPINSLIDDQLRKINDGSDLYAADLKQETSPTTEQLNVEGTDAFRLASRTPHFTLGFFILTHVCRQNMAANYFKPRSMKKQCKQLLLTRLTAYQNGTQI